MNEALRRRQRAFFLQTKVFIAALTVGALRRAKENLTLAKRFEVQLDSDAY